MRGEAGSLPAASAGDGGDRAALLTRGPPPRVVEPGSVDEVATRLRDASRDGLVVMPRGGGTKLDWGRPPRPADLVLSTTRLDRVVEHAWADMTATVEAGCTVARLQHTLAEHGQRLACDPLWPERATIGGILATNDTGPLRARFGGLRDLIIGVTLVLPDGTVAKSGGKVVKNVAGYDLPKLAIGSFGTLAVITQAVFRLHPLPHATRTFTFAAPALEPLCELALAIQGSQLAFVSLQLRAGRSAEPALDVGFEGTQAGVDSQQDELLRLGASLARVDPPRAVWRAREALWQGTEPAVVGTFSVLPTELRAVCAQLHDVGAAPLVGWRVVAQGVGVGQFRLEGATSDALLGAVQRLREAAERRGGTLVVLVGPEDLKAQFDVWGPPGDALPLLQRVKQQLDPGGTLSPGRFVGGL
ncbi:MAG TPA: FAD-binding oxidoreductase [Gemmatimonadales bacterium]|nr:FAD-binding oxidoreductase [Gemmatimonadales bacterium]